MKSGWGSWVFRFNDAAEATTGGEGAGHSGPHRPAGCHHVLKDSIDRVFVEDAEISICMKIHFRL